MSSLTDRPGDSSIEGRELWLGQVSEAATALAGTRVPKQLNDIPDVSKTSTGRIADKSILRSVRQDDSVNPAGHVAKTHVRSSSKLAAFTRLIIILAAVVTTLTLLEGLSRTEIRQWLTNNGLIEVFSLPVTSDPVTAISAERTSPKLIIQPSRGTPDEPVPLGLEVDGLAEGVIVYIAGLVPGMELSMGTPVGADAWKIPATELGYAWIAPPQGFVGTAKLIAELRLPNNKIADRQAIHFAWELPISAGPVLHQSQEHATLQSISSDPVHIQPDQTEAITSSQALVTAPARFGGNESAAVPSIPLAHVHLQNGVRRSKLPAFMLRQLDANEIGAVLEPVQLKPDRDKIVPAPSAPALQRQLDGQEIMMLLKRGKDLIAAGDLAAARLVLRRAADANNAEAALALGATYDPFVLRELKVYGFTPDAAMARVWYEKAIELGSPAAPRRLEMLTQETGTR
jgi:hypothetical protein